METAEPSPEPAWPFREHLVGSVERPIELLIEVSHFEQFDIGELQDFADIVAFTVDEQRRVPVDDDHVVRAIRQPGGNGLVHFLIRERAPLGAQDLCDLAAIVGAQLCRVDRMRQRLDMEDHIVFDNRGEVRLRCSVADDLQQVVNALARVGEEQGIVVEFFAEPKQVFERAL